jgi:hypothetical protein
VTSGLSGPGRWLLPAISRIGFRRYPIGRLVAVAMAGTILAITPKRTGRRLAAGNACAVFESGKFVAGKGGFRRGNRAQQREPDGTSGIGAHRPLRRRLSRRAPGCDVAQPYRQLMQEADFTGCSGGLIRELRTNLLSAMIAKLNFAG